jgi:hypothetical protein
MHGNRASFGYHETTYRPGFTMFASFRWKEQAARSLGLPAALVLLLVGLRAVAWSAEVPPAATHPTLGQKFVPSDVDLAAPIYRSSFDDASATADWKLEGGKSVGVADGRLVLESHEAPLAENGSNGANKDHLVCWLKKEVPADFLLEFSVRPRNRRDGLNIIFFNARGVKGESVFDPGLAPRNGDFKQYHSGDLKNYHVSYWASSLENGPRGDANLRKNPGHRIVSVGRDLVTPAPADSFQKIRLYKRGGMIRLMVDDVVSVAFDDDGTTNGPVWGHSGWIGLRQMGRTLRAEYDDLAVYPLKPQVPNAAEAGPTENGSATDTLAESETVATDACADAPAAAAASSEVLTTGIAWPPEYMKNLPADYLARLRWSLPIAMERLDRFKAETSEPRDSIGWVRYGLPALMLGKRVDEINRFFESDRFIVTANPKFGFSLFGVSYVRLYGLMNRHTGPLRGPLSVKSQEAFERGLWEVAKVNSKLVEGKRPVWDTEGSENHHLASKTCDLLVAQFLRKLPQYASQKYDDGSTLEEQYQARLAYFLEWFDERAKKGQYTEAASPSYQADSVNAIFNIRDFAEDPLLRRKAEIYLDLTYAVIAEETLLTSRGGPKSRVKVGHEYDEGIIDRGYNVMFDAPGRGYEPIGDTTRATSNYYPPQAIVDLARDTKNRGTYSFATRWPGPIVPGKGKKSGDPDGVLWRAIDADRSVLRKGFCTPNYVLGSVALPPDTAEDASSGFRWQGVVFAGDKLARIGFEVQPSKKKNWHGFNPFWTTQDRNLFVTECWAPVPPNDPVAHPAGLRAYFSPTLDEVVEEKAWIFVREGAAFAAVKVTGGEYTWTPKWKHADELTGDNKAFITLDNDKARVILYCADASDYGDDFAKFRAVVAAQPIVTSDGMTHFSTIVFPGHPDQGTINGKPVDIAPERGNDSPFVRSEWNSGKYYIRKGDATLTLDFSDPRDPKKTIGTTATDDYPSGVGTTKPIVFE